MNKSGIIIINHMKPKNCFMIRTNAGQVITEYVLLSGFLVLGMAAAWLALRQGLFDYYRFLVKIVCLPIP